MSGLSWCWRRGSYSPSHLAASCCAKMRKFKIGKRDLKIFIPCFLALVNSVCTCIYMHTVMTVVKYSHASQPTLPGIEYMCMIVYLPPLLGLNVELVHMHVAACIIFPMTGPLKWPDSNLVQIFTALLDPYICPLTDKNSNQTVSLVLAVCQCLLHHNALSIPAIFDRVSTA